MTLKGFEFGELRTCVSDAPFSSRVGSRIGGPWSWRGRVDWGFGPVCQGAASWRQRARLANSSASGHFAAKAMCAAILGSRIRKVVNSALAND
jgi:hypothetical protein